MFIDVASPIFVLLLSLCGSVAMIFITNLSYVRFMHKTKSSWPPKWTTEIVCFKCFLYLDRYACKHTFLVLVLSLLDLHNEWQFITSKLIRNRNHVFFSSSFFRSTLRFEFDSVLLTFWHQRKEKSCFVWFFFFFLHRYSHSHTHTPRNAMQRITYLYIFWLKFIFWN